MLSSKKAQVLPAVCSRLTFKTSAQPRGHLRRPVQKSSDVMSFPHQFKGEGTDFHLFEAGSFVCSSKTILKRKKAI